jgi:hypothetical protein
VLLVGLFAATVFGTEMDMLRIAGLTLALCGILGLIELVVVIVHWAIVAGFTRELASTRAAGGEDARGGRDPDRNKRDFDEDYRPIPMQRRRSEAEYDE